MGWRLIVRRRTRGDAGLVGWEHEDGKGVKSDTEVGGLMNTSLSNDAILYPRIDLP